VSERPRVSKERLDELESRLTFQDDTIEHLNQVVARQDRELEDLKRQFQAVVERLKDLDAPDSGGGPESDFEVPPHY